jgi:hypothetical protein
VKRLRNSAGPCSVTFRDPATTGPVQIIKSTGYGRLGIVLANSGAGAASVVRIKHRVTATEFKIPFMVDLCGGVNYLYAFLQSVFLLYNIEPCRTRCCNVVGCYSVTT